MYRFDQKLGKAFADAALAALSIEPQAPLKLETLLSSLDRLFQSEVRPYFDDATRFQFMCDRSWPTTDQLELHSQKVAISSSEINEPGTASGFSIQLDTDLERILLQDADSSRLRGPSAGLSIPDLINFISKDQRTVSHLKSKWGISLKAQL